MNAKKPIFDEKTTQYIFKQFLDIYINPEIEKRKLSGRLPDNFELRRAQIIFSVDRENEIRLNNEVKCIITAKLNKSIEADDPIYEHEITDFDKLELTEEDKNALI